jgi:hypothetical protein
MRCLDMMLDHDEASRLPDGSLNELLAQRVLLSCCGNVTACKLGLELGDGLQSSREEGGS